MDKIIAVAIGGAVGTICRYLMTIGSIEWLGRGFPYGTLAINILGSFILCFLAETFASTDLVHTNIRLALTTGFTGGFTTYSAFNLETTRFLQDGAYVRAILYVGLTLVLCFACGIGGMISARAIFG